MAADLVLVAILLGVVRAPGVLLGFILAVILMRVTSQEAGGRRFSAVIRFAIRAIAAIVLFVCAITLWNAGERAFDRMRNDESQEAISASSDARFTPSFAAMPADSAPPGDSATLALQEENAELREQNADMEVAVEDLQRDLEQERERSGIMGMIRSAADDMGIGFGWAAVYFTCFLALWRGQTPGKRLFGLRVIRLNGKPITWWIAFERFGGYTASFSTGLLGFAQILWDRNRQGIHDKVAETVVVLTRDERLSIPTAEPPVQAA